MPGIAIEVKNISKRYRIGLKEEIHDTWMSQVPIGRLIDPQETASAITFLCLPQSGGIRGISLAVDGGRMRSI